MREVTDGVKLIDGLFPYLINTYLIETPEGEVLIDGGTRWVAGKLVSQLRGRKLALMALTHVHPDHQGSAKAVCEAHRVPLACHVADADVMEGKAPMRPNNWVVCALEGLWTGPPYPVAIRWQGGEMVGEWRVVHTPGHTAGHVVFFRERDRVAIVGDVVRNASIRGGIGTMAETPHVFSADPMENRRSMRRLLELRPELICFGHGPPSRDVGRLAVLVEQLR